MSKPVWNQKLVAKRYTSVHGHAWEVMDIGNGSMPTPYGYFQTRREAREFIAKRNGTPVKAVVVREVVYRVYTLHPNHKTDYQYNDAGEWIGMTNTPLPPTKKLQAEFETRREAQDYKHSLPRYC